MIVLNFPRREWWRVVLLGCFCLALCGCLKPERIDVQAVELRVRGGVADLGRVDWSKPSQLAGEWEFFADSLVEPGFQGRSASFAAVPGTWKGSGFGSYRVRLRHAPASLFLYVRHARSAYRLYANGVLVAANGVVSTQAAGARDLYSPRLAALGNAAGEVELVVQVSNYSHRTGGLARPVVIGSFEVLERLRSDSLALDAFVVGALLLFGFYHLVLFALRRDLGSLYFGLCCWLIALRTLTMGEMLLMGWLPHLPSPMLLRLEYASMFGVILFMAYQQRLFAHIVPWRLFRWYGLFNMLLLASVFLLPSSYFTSLALVWNLSLLGGMLWLLAMSLMACRRRSPDCVVFLGTFLCMLAGTVNDVLNFAGIVHTFELTPITMTVLLLFQSMLLSSQFKRALDHADRLRREAEMRKAREQELRRMRLRLQAMLDALPVAVVGATDEGELLYGNAAFRQGYGLADNWFAGSKRRCSELFPPLAPGCAQSGLRGEMLRSVAMDLEDERMVLVQVEWTPSSAPSVPSVAELLDIAPLPPMVALDPKRRLGVELLRQTLACWIAMTGTDKFELASRSAIWRVEMSPDGWRRTRTLDRYLDEAALPAKPRWNQVERTAEYVLCYTDDDFAGKAALQTALAAFRAL